MASRSKIFFMFFTTVLLAVGFLSCETDSNVASPDPYYFIKYYGGNGNQSGVDLIRNEDGTLLLLGNWQEGTSNHIYLVKTDPDGNVQWEKHFGLDNDIAKDIEQIDADRFVILSDHLSSSGNHDVKLIRITAAGEKIDSTTYLSADNEISKSVTPVQTGGFIVTGTIEIDTTNIPGNPNEVNVADIFHYRCDDNYGFNESTWRKKAGSGTFDGGLKVIQNTADQFYVFGFTNGTADSTLGKMNMVYYPITQGELGEPSYLGDVTLNTTGSFVVDAPAEVGGGFFLVGTTANNTGQTSLHISKLRSSLEFNPSNDREFDRGLPVTADNIGTLQLKSVSATDVKYSTRGYLVLADQVRGNGTTNIWLTKVDLNGDFRWSATFGSEDENDRAAAVSELPDGRILVLGTMGFGDNQTKMAVLKLNSEGKLLK